MIMQRLIYMLLGLLMALALVAGVVFLVTMPEGDTARGADLDGGMKQDELPTEAFANALHDCSLAILAGNLRGMENCFAREMDGTLFPASTDEMKVESFDLGGHGWQVPAVTTGAEREQVIASMEGMLAHFSVVEDLRFKVKNSAVESNGERVEGKLAFKLVGRDAEGRREWLRGKALVRGGRGPDESWPLDRFEITEIASMVAPDDLFVDVAAEAGISAQDPPVLEHPTRGLAAYGGAAADVNGDGLMDLFSTGHEGNYLYLNQGDGTFRDVAAEAFIRILPRPAAGALFLDYDHDGDQDLFLSSFGPQYLFENRLVPDGRLLFRDVSQEAGVDHHAVGFSVAGGDLTGDGFTDIYVASYNDYGRVLPDRWDAGSNGTANLLLVNQGDGTFKEMAEELGMADTRWSYAAAMADVDGDADLDLYVANDFGGGNSLFINDDHGFNERAMERGVHDGGYCMGVSFGDYDRDGDLDLHVTRMSSTAGRRILARLDSTQAPGRERLGELAAGNALYQNRGDGMFRDVSQAAGPFSAGWAWGGGFIDINNDGFDDLHTPNGFLSGPSMKDT
jgi:hypothetical protein